MVNRLRNIAGLVVLTGHLLAPGRAAEAQMPYVYYIPKPATAAARQYFQPAESCMACHNGLTDGSGDDISIGSSWRASMMANSARDPYWQAGVRREVVDHSSAAAAIENECSRCHMPMATHQANIDGLDGGVFSNIPADRGTTRTDILAADGVSCTTCHQIVDDDLGERSSFVGHFSIDTTAAPRYVMGPYDVHAGLARIMESASGFTQKEAAHIQQAGLCATCHTLFTHSLGPDGEVVGELPEQVPYLEWLHSAYSEEKSCQSCHMPEVEGETPIASVLGEPRPNVSLHRFQGGNFFMPRMLNAHSGELAVKARSAEFTAVATRTIDHLANRAAGLAIDSIETNDDRLRFDVVVENLAGHKLPTAYPSRRVWIHLTVRDDAGAILYETGRLQQDGSIEGNDNDADPGAFEPHHDMVTDPNQVQIYEAILGDPTGNVTTGLLTAVTYLKDNRILPRGFDKSTAGHDIAVHGLATGDSDFEGSRDRVGFDLEIPARAELVTIEARLMYQPIGYRWARNLAGYGTFETDRFVRYFEGMADASATVLAATEVILDRPNDRGTGP